VIFVALSEKLLVTGWVMDSILDRSRDFCFHNRGQTGPETKPAFLSNGGGVFYWEGGGNHLPSIEGKGEVKLPLDFN
jgi:hypothetical protein